MSNLCCEVIGDYNDAARKVFHRIIQGASPQTKLGRIASFGLFVFKTMRNNIYRICKCGEDDQNAFYFNKQRNLPYPECKKCTNERSIKNKKLRCDKDVEAFKLKVKAYNSLPRSVQSRKDYAIKHKEELKQYRKEWDTKQRKVLSDKYICSLIHGKKGASYKEIRKNSDLLEVCRMNIKIKRAIKKITK